MVLRPITTHRVARAHASVNSRSPQTRHSDKDDLGHHAQALKGNADVDAMSPSIHCVRGWQLPIPPRPRVRRRRRGHRWKRRARCMRGAHAVAYGRQHRAPPAPGRRDLGAGGLGVLRGGVERAEGRRARLVVGDHTWGLRVVVVVGRVREAAAPPALLAAQPAVVREALVRPPRLGVEPLRREGSAAVAAGVAGRHIIEHQRFDVVVLGERGEGSGGGERGVHTGAAAMRRAVGGRLPPIANARPRGGRGIRIGRDHHVLSAHGHRLAAGRQEVLRPRGTRRRPLRMQADVELPEALKRGDVRGRLHPLALLLQLRRQCLLHPVADALALHVGGLRWEGACLPPIRLVCLRIAPHAEDVQRFVPARLLDLRRRPLRPRP